MVKQIDNPVEHALTKQESIKLMKIINSISDLSKNGRRHEVIKFDVVTGAGVTKLLMETKSISKVFTTSRTGDNKFYPVLHWCITLSDDRGFDWSLDQCTKTEYMTHDGEVLDNLM